MTRRFVVVGNPVGHSLSPRIHRMFALQTGRDLQYETLLAPLDGFVRTLHSFFAAGGSGANVTLPFKEAAFDWVTSCDEYAGSAGAVNTIVASGGEYRGYNTDGIGLVRDLTTNLGCDLKGKRVLILGAGGAVRGIIGPLLGASPSMRGRCESNQREGAGAGRSIRRSAAQLGESGRARSARSISSSMEHRPDWWVRCRRWRRAPSSRLSYTTWCMAKTRRRSVHGRVSTVRRKRSTASACWLNRRLKRSRCFMACGRIAARSWPSCATREARAVHRRCAVSCVWRGRPDRRRRIS